MQALPSLDQDLADGLQVPAPLSPGEPARAILATSFVHKRSLHDREQGDQVYQVGGRSGGQLDKLQIGRRREVAREKGSPDLQAIDNNNNSNNNRNDVAGVGNSRHSANEELMSNSNSRLQAMRSASVGGQTGKTEVPIAPPPPTTDAKPAQVTTTSTTVPSVRDEINNRSSRRDNIMAAGNISLGSWSRLKRRQVNAGGEPMLDDEDSPLPAPSIASEYSPTPLRLTGQSAPMDDDDSDSDDGRLVVASSIQQQYNRTARPGARSGQRNSDRRLIGSTGQSSNGANSTGGGGGGGKRLKRPQYTDNKPRPMATPNQLGASSGSDLVSLSSELNSTAAAAGGLPRLNDRTRDGDDEDNGDDNAEASGDTGTGAMGHHKTPATNVDDPLLIDQQSANIIGLGGPVGGDAMLAVGAVPPASSLERSSRPTIAGLVYRAPFFTSWFVSTWNILFMPVFTLISSCCFRNEDSTTKKLLV